MWKMEVPEVPGVPQAASHYSLLTKAGPFLFLAGQIAYDPLTKKVIKNIWDLPEEGRKAIETGRDAGRAINRAAKSQWLSTLTTRAV